MNQAKTFVKVTDGRTRASKYHFKVTFSPLHHAVAFLGNTVPGYPSELCSINEREDRKPGVALGGLDRPTGPESKHFVFGIKISFFFFEQSNNVHTTYFP